MYEKDSFDLDDRLITFSLSIIELADKLPNSFGSRHIANQLIRSGSAPALHYAEAHATESRKDFIHKMKTALKELRETYTALRIVKRANWLSGEFLSSIIDENNQLIAIFVTSVATAERNERKARENKKNKSSNRNADTDTKNTDNP